MSNSGENPPVVALAAVVMAAALFGGCAAQPYLQQAHEEAVKGADLAMEAARVAYCDAVTLGALRRQYGRDVAGLGDYLRACGWSDDQVSAWVDNWGRRGEK